MALEGELKVLREVVHKIKENREVLSGMEDELSELETVIENTISDIKQSLEEEEE